MNTWWLWILVLLASVWAAHWGAEHLAHPLKKLRKQWGFSVAAGGALVGLAAASPEIAMNTSSAIKGVSEIGLGVMLGSNILAIPVMVTTAYFATRKKSLGKQHQGHQQHLKEHLIQVVPQAVSVQAVPYLLIILVLAALTLPKKWQGLQAIDGWIMLGLYVVYLTQALLRGRKESEQVDWSKKEKWLALGGIAALAAGAYFAVLATKNIVSGLGISNIIGGLFITAPVAVLPEVFATQKVARSGQVTSAVTSVIGDHVVTITVAFLPLALVGLMPKDELLYKVNLLFVFLMPLLYAIFIHVGSKSKREKHGFTRWQVFCFPAVYLIYLFVVIFFVLKMA